MSVFLPTTGDLVFYMEFSSLCVYSHLQFLTPCTLGLKDSLGNQELSSAFSPNKNIFVCGLSFLLPQITEYNTIN